MPLRDWEHEIPSRVKAAQGFSEMSIAIEHGIMPHVWFDAPRWSRVITMTVVSANRKLDWLQSNTG